MSNWTWIFLQSIFIVIFTFVNGTVSLIFGYASGALGPLVYVRYFFCVMFIAGISGWIGPKLIKINNAYLSKIEKTPVSAEIEGVFGVVLGFSLAIVFEIGFLVWEIAAHVQ